MAIALVLKYRLSELNTLAKQRQPISIDGSDFRKSSSAVLNLCGRTSWREARRQG
jgi:hypothetical protein